jgi:hypothetical protein
MPAGDHAMASLQAFEEQLKVYRRMTGEQRFAVALRMHELACDAARERIRQHYRGATAEEVEQELRRRIRLTYEDPNHVDSLTRIDVKPPLDEFM